MVPIKKSGSTKASIILARLIKLAGLAFAYCLIARWSLLFTLEGTHASPIWPPSGVALAAMLLLGHRIWPAITAGAFAANILTFQEHNELTLTATGLFMAIALGNTLEALFGYHLARKLGIEQQPLAQPQPIFKFAIIAVLVAAIAASVGAASFVLGGLAPRTETWPIWFNWWLGDLGGMLVFLPVILIWLEHSGPRDRPRWGESLQALAIMGGFIGLTLLTFSDLLAEDNLHRLLLYLCIPYLAWIAFHYHRRGASFATLVFAAIAVWATTEGHGPFVTGDFNSSLLSLVGFVVLFSITGLLLAADMSHRTEYGRVQANARDVGVHWLTLLAALGLTILAWHAISRDTERTAETRFRASVEEIAVHVQEQITRLDELLRGSAGILAASRKVTRDEWRVYMEHIDIERHVPRISSIAFDAWIGHWQKEAHIAEIRAEGLPAYRIWPESSRSAYLPITYIEPGTEANRSALGYDLYANDTHRAAITYAIESGNIAITPRSRLPQDNPGAGAAFRLFVPVYRHGALLNTISQRRAAVYGMVSSGLYVADMMLAVLGHVPKIGVEVYDGHVVSDATRLYTSPQLADKPPAPLPLIMETPLEFDNHTWTLRAQPLPAFNATVDRQKAQIVLIAGYLISLLLFIVVRSLAVTRENALMLATQMTDALRDSESQLRMLNDRFELASEAGGIGVWDWNIQSNALTWDARMYEIYRLAPSTQERNYEMWQRRVHPNDIGWLEEELSAALAGRKIYAPEFRIVLDDGSQRWIKANALTVRSPTGQPLHMVGINMDITDLRQAEESLSESEERFRSVYEHAPIGMAMFALDGRWLDANNAACEILGYSREKLQALTLQQILHPEDLPPTLENVQRLSEGLILSYQLEQRYLREDGSTVWALATVTLLRDESDKPLYFIAQIMDIKDRRQKEQATAAALAEKEVLLKEVYHRVKNNLQVITSLLNLQLRALPEGPARTALKESSERVRAMSLVHEKLYQSHDLSSIALENYIEDLCRQLGAFAAASERGIALVTEVEHIEIGLELAVPLGLLLNELISNSLKHGFPDGRSGNILIRLARVEAESDTVRLEVADDGIGLPPSLNIQTSPSLGLKLVGTLASQIDARFAIESENGTRAQLTFRIHEPVRPSAARPALERT